MSESKEKLSPANFRLDLSGFMSNIWYAALPEKQTFDDCLEPSFWMHVVDMVAGENKADPKGIGHEIVVFKRDAMQKRRYMITGIGSGFIRLAEIERAGVADVAPLRADAPLKTRWNPGKKCHEVIRLEGVDGASVTVLRDGFQTKAEAIAWLNDHVERMAA